MANWVVDVFTFGFIGWFAILTGVITLRLLQGTISLGGLLTSRLGEPIDAERVQSLAVFAFVISAYGLEGLDMLTTLAAQPAGPASMPDIPDALLVLLAGSNSLYLGGKITRNR